MARRAACLLAATVWLTGVGPARAATVVLVHAPDARWRLAELRVRDELRSLGMTVTDAGPRGRDDGAMATLIAEQAAVAAVQISRTGERADVTLWFVDADTSAPRRLEFAVEDSLQPGLVALRAAERVRTETRARPAPEPAALASTPPAASLVPLAPASTSPAQSSTPIEPTSTAPTTTTNPPAASTLVPLPAAPPPAPFSGPPPPTGPSLPEFTDDLPPALPAAPAPPVRRHGLLVAATIGGGPGGAGLLAGLDLAGRRELGRRLEFSGGVTTLVTSGWREDVRGSILLGVVAGRAQLGPRWQLGPRTTLRIGLGGGVGLGWAVGRANSPYRGVSDVQPVGMLSATLALAVRLGPRLSAHGGLAVDVLLPPLSIRSGGVEAFRVGQPLLRGVLGLAWDWPLRPR
ncbi:hypothetical protein [Nannocystis punicea]|uniref:Uncharacterized protein n=1 Tax=Nannocystis punicea TaxID=2995304 RepID=A0ABY7H338_9BACT|nr:hypothetical protein [Nannocystis poenicansa]WAS93686.1 hypothetical protein O0S08_46735 [Nannocystis poenicansa]